MSEGSVFLGYFSPPGSDQVFKAPIQLWYDTVDESAKLSPHSELKATKVGNNLGPPTPSSSERRFSLTSGTGSMTVSEKGKGALYCKHFIHWYQCCVYVDVS